MLRAEVSSSWGDCVHLHSNPGSAGEHGDPKLRRLPLHASAAFLAMLLARTHPAPFAP